MTERGSMVFFTFGRFVQITEVFLDGHSNPQVKIIGRKLTPVMEHLSLADPLQQGPLLYSSA